jgi:hypothetical protein
MSTSSRISVALGEPPVEVGTGCGSGYGGGHRPRVGATQAPDHCGWARPDRAGGRARGELRPDDSGPSTLPAPTPSLAPSG